MFSVLLAWINSKYETKYDLLFLGTFLLDLEIIRGVFKIITMGE